MSEPTQAQVRELVAFCDKTAWWLDDCMNIPLTRFRFGLDALAGLIPFAGDALAAGVSIVTITRAARIGVPRGLLFRMGRNVAIDFAGGLIPGLGDVFDAVFKSHRRNFELLRREYATMLALPEPRRRAPLWLRTLTAAAVAAAIYAAWQWFRG